MRFTCTDWAALCAMLGVALVLCVAAAARWLDARARARHDALVAMLRERTPAGLQQMASGLLAAAQSVDAARDTVDAVVHALARAKGPTRQGPGGDGI